MTGIYFISFLFIIISMLISFTLQNKFSSYGKILLQAGLSGKEIAEKMLEENGIQNVKVTVTHGFLTDYYNPITKTVNLSEEVYNGRSIAAAAVAAHECGHAVQHATAYRWLMLRSRLVPVVQISSMLVQWVLLIGIITISIAPNILLIGIGLFAITTLFSLITLPVEFNASNRALSWLTQANITNKGEYEKAKDALKWAAMTYVVAAVASVVTLLQYILIFLSGRERD